MKLERYKSPSEFLRRTHATLEQDDARNNLVLGIALRINEGHSYGIDPPYLASIDDDGIPIVMALMTPPHRLLLSGNDEADIEALKLLAIDLTTAYPSIPGVIASRSLSKRFADEWSLVTGAKTEVWMNQRLYKLTNVKQTGKANGKLRHSNPSDFQLLIDWACAMSIDIRENAPMETVKKSVESRIKDQTLFIWEDVVPVSMVASARPMKGGISINYVYTPPKYRCRGYATSCVAAMCKLLLDSGYGYVSLVADLANPISNGIYMKIGFEPVFDFDEYNFIYPQR